MFYNEFTPSSDLCFGIAAYWVFDLSGVSGNHRFVVPPEGCLSLLVVEQSPGQVVHVELYAPRLGLHEVDIWGGMRYWGVRFYPGAFACFWDISCKAVVEAGNIPLSPDDFFQFSDQDTVNIQSIESWLRQRVRRKPDEQVQKVVGYLMEQPDGPRLDELLNVVHIGKRQLQRRFLKETGLTMKSYIRILRARKALRQLLSQTKTLDIVHDLGYYDQAHLIHELGQLLGRTPTEIKADYQRIKQGNVIW
ncbi:MAG: helix-turn-helix domain-containing protein [Bernardetiaceae bacterium]